MSYDIKPYPEWSYSLTRDRVFQECLRKYYYHYYASHNGWLTESASELQIAAYRLKQLTNLYLHFGLSVHSICANAVTQWQKEGVVPSYATLNQRLRKMLNQAYLESRDKDAWRLRPNRRFMLAEMYYDGVLEQEEVAIIRERMRLCLENFLQSQTLMELTRGEAADIIEMEQLNSFVVHASKVYVSIDLLYRRPDGTWVIVDWKTGKEAPHDEEQLVLYALYVKETYGVPLERLELKTEYLLTGDTRAFQVKGQDIEVTVEKIGKRMEQMKRCLDDADRNRPKPMSRFTPQPSPGKCRRCHFREICDGRE